MVPPSDQQDEHGSRSRPARHNGAEASSFRPDPLDVDLAAHWVAASLARDRTQLWLEANRWPPGQTDELVLAVSEAVSNSVEHGYLVPPESLDHPGMVRLRGRITTADDGFRTAVLVVSDDGSWKEPDHKPERGMGLLLMRACAEALQVDGSFNGTRVELVSRPVPPLP